MVLPHPIVMRIYVDNAHRDSDLMWQKTANLNKIVRVDNDNSFYILVSVGPTVWQTLGSVMVDTQPHGGGGYANNAVETAIAVQDTFYVIAGTFVASPSLHEFTINAAGLLTYTGLLTRHVHIASNFDFTSAANNQEIQFKWFLNGTEHSFAVTRKAATGADVGAVAVHDDAQMSTGDTLQLRVRNRTSTANMTCGNVYLFAMGMV